MSGSDFISVLHRWSISKSGGGGGNLDDSDYQVLDNRRFPIDKNEARKLRRCLAHYAFKFGQLYKKGYSVPLLKCITPERGLYVMQEIHEGVYGNHSGPRSLFHKVILQGYYWPTIKVTPKLMYKLVSPVSTSPDSLISQPNC